MSAAKEISEDEITEDMERVTSLYAWQAQEDFSKPLGEVGQELFYWLNGNTFNVYRRLTEEEIEANSLEEAENEREEMKLNSRRAKLEELWRGMKQLREDFILAVYEFKQEHLTVIAPILLEDEPTYRSIWCEIKQLLPDLIRDLTPERVAEMYVDEKVFDLLAVKAYVKLALKASAAYSWYRATYEENKGMERLYEFLKKLGYEMSDEEAALLDGSHELYEKG